ncbi:MAG: hypothetical protein ACOH12_00945 [Parvibaculaceae bacterium]
MSPPSRILLVVFLLLSAGLSVPAGAAATQMAPVADDDEPAPAISGSLLRGSEVPDEPMSETVTPLPDKRSQAAKSASSDDDLMCTNAPADTVQPVPAPFKFWMVLVCAPQAQALVPIKGMVWFAHGTKEPVSVLALPPGASALPRTADYNPSYNVRFKNIYASEAKGKKLARALDMLTDAQTKGKPVLMAKEVERVYQLDAISSIYDMRYNIYFYVSDNVPRAGLICIDACRQMLLVDVLNDEEARARMGKP